MKGGFGAFIKLLTLNFRPNYRPNLSILYWLRIYVENYLDSRL